MKKPIIKLCLLAAAVSAASGANAADIRLNGFLSAGGGKAISQGKARDALGNAYDVEYTADAVTEGFYGDDITFSPDSNYGLQISADLGNGLSATGQVTGNGGESFEAVISWAYISYAFNENVSVQVGRQRQPLFYYSDFIDVGYAYHWIRPPQDLSANSGDTFDGIQLRWHGAAGSWDFNADVRYGEGEEDLVTPDLVATNYSVDMYGAVLKASNSWLVLRASFLNTDTYVEIPGESSVFLGPDLQPQLSKEDPINYTFIGLAANVNFGNAFVVAEYTYGDPEDATGVFVFADTDNDGTPDTNAPVTPSGSDTDAAWYISAGYRLGAFTPHITYGEREHDYVFSAGSFDPSTLIETTQKSSQITVGVRWDFHPSAAFKLEYLTRSDESDDFYKNNAGIFGQGFGDSLEVDLVSFSVDVIF
ncbi:hypothetical protein [Halioxenophilus sp. WMMB6]|uniref:hypothetical protein n=1 Tax=Halioxenophilus sp. WMMB6 TaxID=3073815 RepID=UPI00295EC5AD|nr:hypothetical protein [Halioxenophilus sp. WMMB6]